MPISVRIDRDIVLEPDLLSIRHGSKADNLETTCIEGPPTLMIKILPKSTASRDLNRKREMYEQYGVEEYWIVDSLERAITALQLADRRHQPISQSNDRFTSLAISGLEINVAELFAGTF